jgi:hypothetical protein
MTNRLNKLFFLVHLPLQAIVAFGINFVIFGNLIGSLAYTFTWVIAFTIGAFAGSAAARSFKSETLTVPVRPRPWVEPTHIPPRPTVLIGEPDEKGR